MQNWLLSILFAAVLARPVFADLFLINGTPNPRGYTPYGTELLRLDDDGKLQSVTTIVLSEAGVSWLAISYDWRKAVMEGLQESSVWVFDLDKLAVTKQCKTPKPRLAYIERWLADVPGVGPSLVWYEYQDGKQSFERMVLDPGVSCADSFSPADPLEINSIAASGAAGVADDFWSEGTLISLTESGELRRQFAPISAVLDLRVPASLLDGFDRVTGLMVNTSKLSVVSEGKASKEGRLLVFDKQSRKWSVVPDSGSSLYVRGFGHFVAFSEGWVRRTPAETSAGSAEWREGDGREARNLRDRFENSQWVQPGRLHIFDVEGRNSYVIDTKQGDSEVLLIENNIVYYRASDGLYSATITKTGLGESKLLVRDDLVRDVHWAFLKH